MLPHNFFAFTAVVFGLIFLIATPPFQAPDEGCHFMRIYQISEGRPAAEGNPRPLVITASDGRIETVPLFGGNLPAGIERLLSLFDPLPFHPETKMNAAVIKSAFSISLDKSDRVFLNFPITALYSPVAYIPQTAGILFGRLLGLSPLLLMYLGRFFNFAVWILLIRIAILKTPVYKSVFALLALMPMTLFQAASLSADGFIYALSFCLIAFILSAAYGEADKPETLLIIITALALSLTKQLYLLIFLLYLCVPAKKAGGFSRQLLFIAAVFLSGLLLSSGWNMAMKYSGGAAHVSDLYKSFTKPDVSFLRQLEFVEGKPLVFMAAVFNTFRDMWALYGKAFVGILGYLDTYLPDTLIVTYFMALLFAALFDHDEARKIPAAHKAVFLLIVVSATLFIFLWNYAMSSPVGADTVRGVQGRYFIPIAPLLFAVFYNRRLGFRHSKEIVKIVSYTYPIIALAISTAALFQRYY